MARINRIDVFVETGDITFGGTNGHVYVGVGGREVALDAVGNDFQPFSSFTYVIGDGDTLKRQFGNNLSQFVDTADAILLPCYIRFVPKRNADKWELDTARVTLNPGPSQVTFSYPFTSSVVLGVDTGKIVYLRHND